MILHCKNCKEKFSIMGDEAKIEGNLVRCKHCHEEWIYESKSKYFSINLQKRLLLKSHLEQN